jgi:hypothetical protein
MVENSRARATRIRTRQNKVKVVTSTNDELWQQIPTQEVLIVAPAYPKLGESST